MLIQLVEARYTFIACCLAASFLFSCTTTQNINSGLWHYKAGLYNEAYPRLESAAHSLEDTSPPDIRYSEVLLALASMDAIAGNRLKADTRFKKAVFIEEGYKDQNDVRLRNSYNQYGNFLLSSSRPTDASTVLAKAVAISEKRFKGHEVLLALDLDNLAMAFSQQSKFKESISLSERAEKALDGIPNNDEVIETRGVIKYNRAYSFEVQGENDEALALYTQALSLLDKPKTLWRARVVAKQLASLLRKLGRDAEAKELEERFEKNSK